MSEAYSQKAEGQIPFEVRNKPPESAPTGDQPASLPVLAGFSHIPAKWLFGERTRILAAIRRAAEVAAVKVMASAITDRMTAAMADEIDRQMQHELGLL